MKETKQNICNSCGSEVSKAELDDINKEILNSNKEIIHDNKLVLCKVCFPWYKIAHAAPKNILGYDIKNPDLFIKESIKVQALLRENWAEHCGTLEGLECKPIDDQRWYQFLRIVMTEEERLSKLKRYIDMDKLPKKSGLTLEKISLEIREHLSYLETATTDQRLLEEDGWRDYAEEIKWPVLDKLTIGSNTFVIERHSDSHILLKEVNNEEFEYSDYPIRPFHFCNFLFREICEERQNKISVGVKWLVRIDSLLSKVFDDIDVPLNPQLQREVYYIIQGYAPQVEKYRFLALWSFLDKIHPETNIHHPVTNLWVENPAWEKSFQLFRSVVQSLGRAIKPTLSGFRILGNSGAIYTVEPSKFLDWNQPWIVKKKGGEGKKICIDITHSMPLGDMLCSLVLSLRDDLNSMKHIHTLNPNNQRGEGFQGLLNLLT